MNFNNFVVGIIICFLLSFVLGLERQYRRRSLGLRTMILVAIGSYIFVSFSFLVNGYQIDISRVASQVVAGIGFFGAGVIIKDNEKNKIRGLTTAATLWCDAGIGILCAGGFIKEAIVASLIVLFSNIVLRYVNHMVNNITLEKNTDELYKVNYYVSGLDGKKIVDYITQYVSENKYIDMDSYLVDEKKIETFFRIKKNSKSILLKFINDTVYKFNIEKYNYEMQEEQVLNDMYDEL